MGDGKQQVQPSSYKEVRRVKSIGTIVDGTMIALYGDRQ